MCNRALPLFGKMPQRNICVNCHVNGTTFRSGLSSVWVSCKRAQRELRIYVLYMTPNKNRKVIFATYKKLTSLDKFPHWISRKHWICPFLFPPLKFQKKCPPLTCPIWNPASLPRYKGGGRKLWNAVLKLAMVQLQFSVAVTRDTCRWFDWLKGVSEYELDMNWISEY